MENESYHVADWDYVIDDEFVENTCPDAWNDLVDFLKTIDLNIFDFAEIIEYDNYSDEIITQEQLSEAMTLYNELVRQFKVKTDFSIKLRFHDIYEYGNEIQTIFLNNSLLCFYIKKVISFNYGAIK
jgi:hypothetical protein